MKNFLFDIFPIIIFFIVYKIWGIYVATATAIAIAVLQTAYIWFAKHKVEKMQITTLVLIVFFGGATLIFHNPIFIKWKVSVLYWLFALILFGSHFISTQTIVQRMLGEQIQLPPKIWLRLSWSWIIFFAFIGFLNLFVILHYSTAIWVDFKLFGILGLTIVFFVAQGFYLVRHVKK